METLHLPVYHEQRTIGWQHECAVVVLHKLIVNGIVADSLLLLSPEDGLESNGLVLLVGQEIDITILRLAMGIGNALGQYGITSNLLQLLFLIGLVNYLYPLVAQVFHELPHGRGYAQPGGHHQSLVIERPDKQGVLVHRVVVIAVQWVHPVLEVDDACRMTYANGAFNHRLSNIGQPLTLGSHTLCTKHARQHGNDTVGS